MPPHANQVAKLVEEAQSSKAPIQHFADRIASIFVPAIVALSLLTFLGWYACCLLSLVPFEWTQHEPFVFSFLFANAVLVVACPCALGLATPTAVLVGTGVGARMGILIKSGTAIELAHKVRPSNPVGARAHTRSDHSVAGRPILPHPPRGRRSSGPRLSV